jgi:hypothetical protein
MRMDVQQEIGFMNDQEGLPGERAWVKMVDRWLPVPQAQMGRINITSSLHHYINLTSGALATRLRLSSLWHLFGLAASGMCLGLCCLRSSLCWCLPSWLKTLCETFIAVWNHSGSLPKSSKLTAFSATMPAASILANRRVLEE